MDGERSLRRNFALSTVIGAYSGCILQLAATSWLNGGLSSGDLWAIPIIVLAYGLFATPAVAFGLMVFGVPARRLLRHLADKLWLVCVAAIAGGLAGKFIFYAVDHLFFFGYYEIERVNFTDLGILYGVPTGLTWWALNRKIAITG